MTTYSTIADSNNNDNSVRPASSSLPDGDSDDPVALRQKAYNILKQLGPVDCEEPQQLEQSFRYPSSYQHSNATTIPRVQIDPRPARMASSNDWRSASSSSSSTASSLTGFLVSCIADACVKTPGAVAYMMSSSSSSSSRYHNPTTVTETKVPIPTTYQSSRYRDDPTAAAPDAAAFDFANTKKKTTTTIYTATNNNTKRPQPVGVHSMEC